MTAGVFENLATAVWPAVFAFDLARYLIPVSVLTAILFLFAKRLEGRRIQSRRALLKDKLRELGYSLNTVFIFSIVGVAVFWGSEAGIFKLYDGDSPGITRLAFEFATIVILHDAYFYWMHRFLHTKMMFRRAHRVHHKSRTPTPWAAYAFAPLEALLEAGILPLAALILPMHELVVFLFLSHMILRNVIGHAGVELFPSWWLSTNCLRRITTTTHHDLHHAYGGHNFGLYFTWWDRLMGTEHPDYEARFVAATKITHENISTTEEKA